MNQSRRPDTLERKSPCKVNLLLNILGKRPDGFHELETVMLPLNLCDDLSVAVGNSGVELTCNDPRLPTDANNLVHRAATAFLEAAHLRAGVRIHLTKKVPLAAGLGGGSSNAANMLLALNELFDQPLSAEQLWQMAASLGSDVPFFLQIKPALATGRGELIQPLDSFPVFQGAAFLLIHPGFGIATAWAYQQLTRFPAAMNGRPGRAKSLIAHLQAGDLSSAAREFYNSLEAPALEKYPLLAIYQDFLRSQGAVATLMSGSGSTTSAIAPSESAARELEEKVKAKFGPCWTSVVAAV